MPIPGFDRFGFLPDGVHHCTLEEVETSLAWNAQRSRLTKSLREFIEHELSTRFADLPPLVLDGSYVTSKEVPGDINLVLELHGFSDQMKMQAIDLCQRCPIIMERYNIDMKPALQKPGNDFVAYYRRLDPRKAIEMNLFHGHTKGLLRIGQ